MKNWTNRSWLARRLCAASLVLLAAALPAHAFQKIALADGGFEYFFAAPSLDIRGVGDLDLTGLSFIEGVTGGFRVGASFDLDWLGGENAWLASPASTWSGLDTAQRTISIAAGGDMRFGAVQISLTGGTFSLSAGESLILGDTTTIDVGGSAGAVVSVPGFAPPTAGGSITLTGRGGDTGDIAPINVALPALFAPTLGPILVAYPVPPTSLGSDGVLVIEPMLGGDITLIGGDITLIGGPLPIPEPATAALMLAGLLALAGVAARRAKAEG